MCPVISGKILHNWHQRKTLLLGKSCPEFRNPQKDTWRLFLPVKDRLPQNILEDIRKEPIVELVGYKMVDGNQFGMVVKLNNGDINWFFEKELSELM